MLRNFIALLALSASVVVGETLDIDVGEDGNLAFDPPEFKAKAGDQLKFHFYSASGPHDVVQGSMDEPGPCIPNGDPFYSGLMKGDSDGHSTFTVNVTSSNPIYFYCSIARHCQAGMVGVVNGPAGAGYKEYKARSSDVASSNRPFNGAQGGVVGTDSEDNHDDDDHTTSATSSATTTGKDAGSGKPTTAPTTSSSASASATDAAASSTGPSGSAAATTTSSAGKYGQTSVYLGLAVVLGGLVALMA